MNDKMDVNAPSNAAQLAASNTACDLMETFQANEGWKYLCAVFQECVEQRDRQLDHPLTKMDEVLAEQYTKGARQAYRHVLAMPQNIIDEAKSIIEHTAPDEEELEEDG